MASTPVHLIQRGRESPPEPTSGTAFACPMLARRFECHLAGRQAVKTQGFTPPAECGDELWNEAQI